MWWSMSLTPALAEQRQKDLCELEATLIQDRQGRIEDPVSKSGLLKRELYHWETG